MDKRSSEQQFHKSDATNFAVWKTGAVALAQWVLQQVDRQAGRWNATKL